MSATQTIPSYKSACIPVRGNIYYTEWTHTHLRTYFGRYCMRDLYKEGYSDAVKQADEALTSALSRSIPLNEQLSLFINHLHFMKMHASSSEDAVTYEDFQQDHGILYIIKGGN